MTAKNDYENAFSLWLNESSIKYSRVSQSRRFNTGGVSVKSFDYVVQRHGCVYVIELKGRLFRGSSFAGLKDLPNWVTVDDVRSIEAWQNIEGVDGAYFVFAYLLDDYFAELDGNDSIDFNGRKFAFFAIAADDYRDNMKARSRKWNTADLSAENFRKYAKKASVVLKEPVKFADDAD